MVVEITGDHQVLPTQHAIAALVERFENSIQSRTFVRLRPAGTADGSCRQPRVK